MKTEELEDFREIFWKNRNVSTGSFVKIYVFFREISCFHKKGKGIFVSTLPHPTCFLSHKTSADFPSGPQLTHWTNLYEEKYTHSDAFFHAQELWMK